MSPFHYIMGFDAVLPVEVEVPMWRTLPWHQVQSHDKLLALHAHQIKCRDKDTEEAHTRVLQHQEKNQEAYDDHT